MFFHLFFDIGESKSFFTNMALFTPLWWTSFVEREAILLRKWVLQRA